jgi:hypothetical protein
MKTLNNSFNNKEIMNNKNPTLELSQEQTKQLREIWDHQQPLLSHEDYLFIKVKLNRTQAKLSKNQAYRMTMTLAETGYESIPEWLLELIDP